MQAIYAQPAQRPTWLRSMWFGYACAICVGSILGQPASTDAQETRPTAIARLLDGDPPETVRELKAFQQQIQRMRSSISGATVAVLVGRANGSGVIIDDKGTVLTAAHVSGRPGREALITLANGETVTGITRGLNQKLDAGMIQITEPGRWPYAPLGKSSTVDRGQWCLATGHPGGYEKGRPPVLRMGRVLRADSTHAAILTDCTLKGGDSGGPLFNLRGEVIGIHSRIGKNLSVNVHVPIDTYVKAWDRLENGDVWGRLDSSGDDDDGDDRARDRQTGRAWLGVVEDPNSVPAKVSYVNEGSPADTAGLLVGDVILFVDDQLVTDFADLQSKIARMRPGREIIVTIQRESESIVKKVRLGRRNR